MARHFLRLIAVLVATLCVSATVAGQLSHRLADSIKTNFEKAGGKITISAAHEDGKADYTAEVGPT